VTDPPPRSAARGPSGGPPGWTAERTGDPGGDRFVVFVHGGFWRERFGAETIEPLARACAAEPGYAVWNLEYPRVGMPGGGWPGTALAVRAAVAAAREAAGRRPLALVGHSAGGHLALWAAEEQPPALVVSLAGVCDLETGAREGIGENAVVQFVGAGPDQDPDRYAEASPIRRLPSGVPVIMVHGDADDRVPIAQSRDYLTAARAAGDECDLSELPGGDHFELIDPRGRAWPIVRERLERLSAPPPRPPGPSGR
jgi:acetyl esterase/lipase